MFTYFIVKKDLYKHSS